MQRFKINRMLFFISLGGVFWVPKIAFAHALSWVAGTCPFHLTHKMESNIFGILVKNGLLNQVSGMGCCLL